MGHWNGRTTKISSKSELIQQIRTFEPNNKSRELEIKKDWV